MKINIIKFNWKPLHLIKIIIKIINGKYKCHIDWYKKENNKNKLYLKKLSKYNTYLFKDVDNAINRIKEIYFENTFIIIAVSIYKYFINTFRNELKKIYVIPKILIFTSTIHNYKKYNKEIIEELKDHFYCFCGIKTIFSKVKNFISKK